MGNQTCCARDYSRKDAEIFKSLSPCASLKDSLSLSQSSLMPKGNMISESTTITDLPSLNSATLSRPLRSKSDDDDQGYSQKKFACTLPYMPSMSDDNEEVLNTEQLTFRPHKVASLRTLNFQGLDTNKLFHDNIDSCTRAKNLNEHILDVFTRQSVPRAIDTASTATRTSPKDKDDVFTPLSAFANTCTGFYDERQSHQQLKRTGETRDTLYATWNSKNLRDTVLMDNSPSCKGSLNGMTPKFIEDLSSFCEFDNV